MERHMRDGAKMFDERCEADALRDPTPAASAGPDFWIRELREDGWTQAADTLEAALRSLPREGEAAKLRDVDAWRWLWLRCSIATMEAPWRSLASDDEQLPDFLVEHGFLEAHENGVWFREANRSNTLAATQGTNDDEPVTRPSAEFSARDLPPASPLPAPETGREDVPADNALANGTWPKRCEQRAFVRGAKWWEFKQTGATMWSSDQRDAEAEAIRYYGEPAAPPLPAGRGSEVSEEVVREARQRAEREYEEDIRLNGSTIVSRDARTARILTAALGRGREGGGDG